MDQSWDKVKELADKHMGKGGIFVRLVNDGEAVVGAFCGEPFAREVIWNGGRCETYDASNIGHNGKQPRLRVTLNFYVPEEGVMKVVEGGSKWFRDILKLRTNYGLDKWLFEIKRHGNIGDTKTTYSTSIFKQIDDTLHAEIKACKLHDLESLVKSQESDDWV
jgi:hypothetical protein